MPDPDKKNDQEEKEQLDAPVESGVDARDEVESGVPALDEVSGDGEVKPESEEASKPDEPESDTPETDESAPPAEDEVTPFDDAETDKAIDEIVAKDGDELLVAQAAAGASGSIKPSRKHGTFGRFIRNKWTRSLLLLVLFGGLLAAMVVPASRYWILNTAGVKSTSSVTVLDSTTRLPLKGVSVSVGGQQAKTDSDGEAKFQNLRLGEAQLLISQVGFEEVRRTVVIGWGSNPLGDVALKASGIRYVIEVRDYLSDLPVEGVEATDGQATAVSGKDGKITLTLASTVVAKEGITLSKQGYRADKISLAEDAKKPTKVAMVLARKAIFATKQDGKYDVYKSDLDGKNREVLLPGTGNENSNISLVVSPDGTRAAYVSTRDNKRDADGFLLSTLVLINVENGSTVTVAEASQIQLVDWAGPRLVFLTASSDSTAANRYAVVSYNYADNTRLQLVAANKLGAVLGAQGAIYYIVNADASNTSLQPGLYKAGLDASNKQRVFDGELVTILRSTYGTLSLQTEDSTWFSYDLAKSAKSQTAAPSNLTNRLYVDNANHSKSLWIGQGTLKIFDIATNKDTDAKAQSGLTYPVQWISDTAVIYRLSSGGETADYAMSILGGSAHKIADVAPTYGFAQAQ